jgi:hypothetical protein
MTEARRLLCSLLLAVLFIVLVFSLGSCTKKSPSSAGPSASGGSFVSGGSGDAKVTFRPEVRLMEEKEGQNALIGVSTDGAALLFDGANGMAKSLKPGDVLVIKGLIARDVLAAQTLPEGIIVLTQQAELAQVIGQGRIHLQAPVRFSTLQSGLSYPDPPEKFAFLRRLIPSTVYAQSIEQLRQSKAEAAGNKAALNALGKGVVSAVTKGWDIKWSATPAAGKLNLNLTMKKDVGGFIGLVTAEGYLADFDFDSDIAVDQSMTQRVEAGMKKINGGMNVNWTVSKDSAGGLTERARMKLPGAIPFHSVSSLVACRCFLKSAQP